MISLRFDFRNLVILGLMILLVAGIVSRKIREEGILDEGILSEVAEDLRVTLCRNLVTSADDRVALR